MSPSDARTLRTCWVDLPNIPGKKNVSHEPSKSDRPTEIRARPLP